MPVSIPQYKRDHHPKAYYLGDHQKIFGKIELVEKIKGELSKADRNKDGRYNKDELKKALKELGAIFPGWRADRCLGKADANHDGEISGEEIDELLEYLLSHGYGK